MNVEFVGEFETHITVSLEACSLSNDDREIDRLQKWCIDRKLKFLHILLDAAPEMLTGCNTRSQPMLTRRGQGNFADELDVAKNLSQSLIAAAFPVVRIKIEAAPENQGIPQSDLEASSHPADRYFEHHIKLLLEPTEDFIILREITQRHSAHLSQNVLRVRADGWQERFVTQRCMHVGHNSAKKQLQILLKSIESLGYNPIDVEAEFVVYDSNLALDRGWIQAVV